MKKITTLLLAILMVLPAMAASIPAGTKLYLTPNGNWKADGARFAAYFFGNGDKWASMTAVAGETDLYEVVVPTPGDFTNVIFCRMNGSNATNDWSAKWDQTNNLVYDGTNNHYTVNDGAWSYGDGTWSYYGESKEVMVGLSYEPSDRIYEGDVITFTASVLNAQNPTTVIMVDDAAIDGKTWTATAGSHKAQAIVTHDAGITESDVVNFTVKEATSFNVYLKKSSTTWSSVYAYYWTTFGDNTWPGKEMEVTTVDGVEYYVYTIRNEENVSVIFNNNNGEQTVDITGVTEDAYYELGKKNGEGKYTAENVTIYDANITAGYYYLVPGEWEDDEAWYAMYLFNKNNDTETWVKGWLSEHNVYFKLEGEDAYTHMIFCRMNPAFNDCGWNSGSEENEAAKRVWNQTADLTYTAPEAGNIKRYNVDLSKWEEVEIGTGVNRVEMAGGIGYAYGVVSAEGAIEVYNVNGAVVARGNDTIDLRGLGRGVYIIRNGNQVRKVVR